MNSFIKKTLYHYFISPIFFLTIIIYAVFLYLRTWSELQFSPNNGLFYFLNFMPKLEGINGVLLLILCLPMGLYYNTVWNSGVALLQVIRLGKKKFILSTLVTIVTGSFITTLIAQLLYALLLNQPLIGQSEHTLLNHVASGGFRQLLLGNYLDLFLYYVIIFVQRAFEVIFYVTLTLIISIKVRDNYIISILPIVLYNLINLFNFKYEHLPLTLLLLLPQFVIHSDFIFERLILELFPQFHFNAIAFLYPFIYLCIFLILAYIILIQLLKGEMVNLGKIEVIR